MLSNPSFNNNAGKNILINSGFVINNGNAGVPYVSGAVLASGQTGHECWKAGASGGDYSFTQLKSNTQITIASGKSLIQVIEDVNVQGTNFTISWSGTAQARVGLNNATPSGTYVSSPLVITGQTTGTVLSVEFNAGTLSNPQLERGSIATAYEYKSYQQELSLSQRYAVTFIMNATLTSFASAVLSGSYSHCETPFPETMQAAPTFTLVNGVWQNSTPTSVNAASTHIHFSSGTNFFSMSCASGLVAAIATARL